MKGLITGGAGFIGSHLAEALIGAGNEVTVVDDLSTGVLANLDPAQSHANFRFVSGDVCDETLMAPLVERADVVFHLAAAVGVDLIVKKPVHTISTNIHGTEVVLGLANKFQKKNRSYFNQRSLRQEHENAFWRGRRCCARLNEILSLELRLQQNDR